MGFKIRQRCESKYEEKLNNDRFKCQTDLMNWEQSLLPAVIVKILLRKGAEYGQEIINNKQEERGQSKRRISRT